MTLYFLELSRFNFNEIFISPYLPLIFCFKFFKIKANKATTPNSIIIKVTSFTFQC